MCKLPRLLAITAIIMVVTPPFLMAKPAVESKTAEINAAKIYTNNCAICHGDDGDGNTRAKDGLNPPPRNFTTVEAAMELTRARMIKSVTYGRPGTGMMAHKDRLSKAEIAAVVDYIRAKFMRTPDEITPQMAKNSEGRQIFMNNCAVCHGDKGNTAVWARNGLNPPPRNFTTDEAARILTRKRMIHSVTNGRPGTGMMPFKTKFTPHQIEAVVDYIRGTFMRLGPDGKPLKPVAASSEAGADTNVAATAGATATPNPAAIQEDPGHLSVATPEDVNGGSPHQGPHAGMTTHQGPHAGMAMEGMMLPGAGMNLGRGSAVNADMSLPLPNGLKGDVAWGRQFFMKNCFTCHGIKGDGKGPRASFNVPRPRNFISSESRRVLNRPRIFNSITHGRVGSVMPAWGKVLDQQQVANLAEFVFEAFIEPDKYNALPKSTPQPMKKKAP